VLGSGSTFQVALVVAQVNETLVEGGQSRSRDRHVRAHGAARERIDRQHPNGRLMVAEGAVGPGIGATPGIFGWES